MRLRRRERLRVLVSSRCSGVPPCIPEVLRTAWAPAWGERLDGASVRARGGTHSGWWPPLAFWGVTARRLPGVLRDVLGLRPPVA